MHVCIVAYIRVYAANVTLMAYKQTLTVLYS